MKTWFKLTRENADRYTYPQTHREGSGKRFPGPHDVWGPPPSLIKYFCYMFDSKTDHLNWAYVSRQLLCDDFSANLTAGIPWMNGCIMCLVSYSCSYFLLLMHDLTHTLTYLCFEYPGPLPCPPCSWRKMTWCFSRNEIVIIGQGKNGFPGPAVALDRHDDEEEEDFA